MNALSFGSPARQRRIRDAVKVANSLAEHGTSPDILRTASVFLYDFANSDYVIAFQEIGTALAILAYLLRSRPQLKVADSWRENQIKAQRGLIADRLSFLREQKELP